MILGLWTEKMTIEGTNGEIRVNPDINMGCIQSLVFETKESAIGFCKDHLDTEEAATFKMFQVGQAVIL